MITCSVCGQDRIAGVGDSDVCASCAGAVHFIVPGGVACHADLHDLYATSDLDDVDCPACIKTVFPPS